MHEMIGKAYLFAAVGVKCTSGPYKVLGINKAVFTNALKSLNSSANRVLIAELSMGLDSITLREDLDAISCLQSLIE